MEKVLRICKTASLRGVKVNELEVWRTLKIPDPEASTIKSVLVRMDYPLTTLDKLEHFLITFGSEITPDVVRDVKELLVNKNKHIFSSYNGDGDPQRFARLYGARVFVETDIDPEATSAVNALRYRFGYGERVHSVRKEIIWGMSFDPALNETEIRRYVQQLVGEPMYFFANPNFQKTRVEFKT